MRPPGGILSPGESIVATGTRISSPMFMLLLSIGTFNTLFNGKRYLAWHSVFDIFGLFLCGTPVFKFVEHPENNEKQTDQKSKVKFKIMSLKVKEIMDYVPELVSDPSDFNYHF